MLTVENIKKVYNGRTVLGGVSFSVGEGDFVSLTGESGSGKTTLLNIITGMDTPDSGRVLMDGIPLPQAYRGTYIGYLPCGNSLIESLTVEENLLLVEDNRATIRSLCGRLGIGNILASYPRDISAGEYKRVCFARVILPRTPYLVLDEPTSNLDAESADLIVSILEEQTSKGIVVATHDPRLIRGTVVAL